MMRTFKYTSIFSFFFTAICLIVSLRFHSHLHANFNIFNALYLALTSVSHYFLLIFVTLLPFSLLTQLLLSTEQGLNWTFAVISSFFLLVLIIDTFISIGKNMLDTNERDWLISGSKIHFGIVEKDRITTMGYDGNYEITDTQLNEIEGAKIRGLKVSNILKQVSSFYKNQ